MSVRLRSPLLPLLAQAALVFLLLFGWLDGRHRDFHVPLQFSHDALEYLMQVKGTIDHGWWWSNPNLSAPGTFDQVAYPSNTNADQALVWIVHLFTTNAPLCLNLSWMILVALSAPVATVCLSKLGISRPVAYAAGVLYALSPYALYRQIEHFALVVYLVPIPCTAALLIATGRLGSLRSRTSAALLAGCVLLGLDYIYYAFFGCFVILIAALVRAAGDRDRRALSQGAVFIGAIVIATFVNLAPTFASWSAHGQPIVIPEKTAAEAEVYGLKIRQLLSPTFEHPLAVFRRWTDEEARASYPAETENVRSRLGLLESAGFLLLLAGILVPRLADASADAPAFLAAGRLTLAAVLLGTVGGFGSLFNLLVSPEIRAYNRLCAFIAFFAWAGLGLAVDRLWTSRAGLSRLRRWAPAAVLLLVGLWDQAPATAALNRDYAATREELAGLRWFVENLDRKLTPGALIFQLPVTTYLNDNGHGQMLPYDHIKPYIVSRQAHWSYPALDNAIVRWQQAVGRLPGPDLIAALEAQHFTAVVVDRYGYADHGEAMLAELGAATDRAAVMAESGRYVALNVRRLPQSTDHAAWLPKLGAGFGPVTSDLPACAGTAVAGIDRIGDSQAPWPAAEVPAPRSGDVTIRGWAIDEAGGAPRRAGDVDAVIDGRVFPTFYGVDRSDVADRLHDPGLRESGFLFKVPSGQLKAGPHVLSVRVLSSDRRCVLRGADLAITVR